MPFLPIIINSSYRFVFFVYFLVILFQSTVTIQEKQPDTDPCVSCKKISDKFIEGYRKTAGSNFGGGNTDWEEKKLKGYAKSETRLIEIMEGACSKSDSQCSSFLEKYEDSIEEWFQTSSLNTIENFHQWLCIDTVKVCCPAGRFGKNCRRCQYGDNGYVCSENGNCNGDGTRSGNGRCECETPYSGTNCSDCQRGYIKLLDENNDIDCSDIDECRSNLFLSPCLLYKCNNTEGGYECYGEPFYRELPKMSTLAVLLFTASILLHKEMYVLASFTLTTASILIILFMKNLL